MDRRRFVLTLRAGALPAPVDAGAQPGKVSRIGYLGYGVPGSDPSGIEGLRHGLSAKSASRAFNAISDLAGMPLEGPRGLDIRRAFKNEDAHATWRA